MDSSASAAQRLFHRAGFLLRRSHQFAVATWATEFKAGTLTPPQHSILLAAHAFPGRPQIELARMVGYDAATAGMVVRGLEKRGLIRRVSTPADRRMKVLHITALGKRTLAAAAPALDRINERVLAPLDPHERPMLIALLEKLEASYRHAEQASTPAATARRPRNVR